MQCSHRENKGRSQGYSSRKMSPQGSSVVSVEDEQTSSIRPPTTLAGIAQPRAVFACGENAGESAPSGIRVMPPPAAANFLQTPVSAICPESNAYGPGNGAVRETGDSPSELFQSSGNTVATYRAVAAAGIGGLQIVTVDHENIMEYRCLDRRTSECSKLGRCSIARRTYRISRI